ncbi:putative clathrin assembly protein At1g03050 [Wolffia australiana]
MAPSRIRKALGAVKDQTSISLAKVGSGVAVSELDVAIVKATRHSEHPAEEKYIREILSLTCYSRLHVSSCIRSIAKRLSKTRSWAVALKCLVLVHRLLNEGDPAYEREFFFATRQGTRFLNLSDFRDSSRSDSRDFSAFVRTFALYLDEHLEFRMQGRRACRNRSTGGGDDDVLEPAPPSARRTPVRELKTEGIFRRTQHLQLLLERFLACRPTGAAKSNRIVAVALYPMVKESYQIYFDLTEMMGIFIDRFMELQVSDCVRVHEIFARLSKQLEELDLFYAWCKKSGIARTSEYPDVEKITPKKLAVMEEFIREKSALASRKKKPVEPEPEPIPEPDMNSIKALPAPEIIVEVPAETITVVPCEEDEEEEEKKQEAQLEKEPADFLNLWEDALKPEEHDNQLALALFDGGGAGEGGATLKWEAFTTEEPDSWETALVQSASSLPDQKPVLGGGFDQLLLDAMYHHAPTAANAGEFTGSASSVSLPQAQRLLALPAAAPAAGDPFAASLAVAPPSYVQISDMGKKQQFLVEEQMMWQQYAIDGMQGQLGLARLQQNPHPMGGYQQRF